MLDARVQRILHTDMLIMQLKNKKHKALYNLQLLICSSCAENRLRMSLDGNRFERYKVIFQQSESDYYASPTQVQEECESVGIVRNRPENESSE